MKFVAIQFDIVWEDKPANHSIVEAMLAAADLPSGSFVLLPEMGDTGFSFDLARIVDQLTLPWATALARKHRVWIQAGYAIRGNDHRGRNCASIITPEGEVAATYQKVHPFSYGREIEYFTGGDHLSVCDCDGASICPFICYDLRFPELWRLGLLAGAEVYTIGANWPAARQEHFRTLLIARAIENQAYVVAVNRVGTDPHLEYAGGSIIIDPKGAILAEAGREPQMLAADLDLSAVATWRTTFPALADIHRELLGSFPVGGKTHRGDAESAKESGERDSPQRTQRG